ncbi:hypothetical protein VIGAN_11085700 [Vigna angularis var. angularis]|uniref:Uncharacterized protein n=1 Tax=Vigna angularis var. angularis TaxID=157739 RepID=A0A0S3T8M8_PHAAN|nr:hypothetical protein VIGAN_11085700 [Vigna angularis var. angularis]
MFFYAFVCLFRSRIRIGYCQRLGAHHLAVNNEKRTLFFREFHAQARKRRRRVRFDRESRARAREKGRRRDLEG